MIEEVVSVDLAVHERLTVRKNRLAPKRVRMEMNWMGSMSAMRL